MSRYVDDCDDGPVSDLPSSRVADIVPAAATAATGSAFRVWYGEAADAYEQGYVNGAAQATTTERERIIGMLWAEVTKNRDSEADFAHCAISAGALEDFAALLDAGAES